MTSKPAVMLLLLLLLFLNPLKTRVGKIKKNTKKFEGVLRGKTVVQQYDVKSLNGNIIIIIIFYQPAQNHSHKLCLWFCAGRQKILN